MVRSCLRSQGVAVLTDLDVEISDLVGGLSVTSVGELADVLEGVGGPGTAHLLDATNHHAEAVEVLRVLGGVGGLLEVGSEELVNELTVGELLLHLRDGLGITSHNALVEDVEVVLARVNRILAGSSGVSDLLVVVGVFLDHTLGKGHSSALGSTLEVTDWLAKEGGVTEDLDGGSGGLFNDSGLLGLEGLSVDVVGLGVLHPVDGEQVTEAGTDVSAINGGLGTAVSAPGGLGGVGGGKSVDVLVSVKVGEHGSGLAGFKVEDEFAEHLGVLHGLEGAVELVSVDPVLGSLRGADETGTTMIDEVDEDLGVLVRLESGTVGVVTEENVEEVLLVDLGARVVDLGLVIDVDTWGTSIGGLVEKLAGEGVVSAVGNIVVGQMDDLVTGDTVLHHDLDGVMGVSLMTVVAVGVGASHDDSPVVGLGGGSVGGESGGSERFHLCF